MMPITMQYLSIYLFIYLPVSRLSIYGIYICHGKDAWTPEGSCEALHLRFGSTDTPKLLSYLHP